jgi:hypothetical protein
MADHPLRPVAPLEQDEERPTGRDLVALETRTGTIQSIATNVSESIAAGKASRRINRARIAAAERIERTAINLVEERLRRTLVAASMTEIGALTVDLHARTTAVQQSLTNGLAADVGSHLVNRNENVAVADDLLARGQISEEEHALYVGLIQADLHYDIKDSHARARSGKKAAGRLHESALKGIGGGLSD